MAAKASTVPAMNARSQPVMELLERVTATFSLGGRRLRHGADDGEAA